jgi:hypothetical protein
MFEQHGDRVEFFVIYIREAHPTDGWQVESNERDEVFYAQPRTLDERENVADACSLRLDLKIPTLIDDMENSTDRKYYALPDRLYLIGRDGKVAYRGAPGPFGFVADELEHAIVGYLEGERAAAK